MWAQGWEEVQIWLGMLPCTLNPWPRPKALHPKLRANVQICYLLVTYLLVSLIACKPTEGECADSACLYAYTPHLVSLHLAPL